MPKENMKRRGRPGGADEATSGPVKESSNGSDDVAPDRLIDVHVLR